MNKGINIILPETYGGYIKTFPPEVVKKMIEMQVLQGNNPDITVFEKGGYTNKFYGGFDWLETPDGAKFWNTIIVKKEFKEFFEKYPFERVYEKPKYPRLMLVSNDNIHFYERVVFCEKNNKYVAWFEGDNATSATGWKYAKEINEEKEEKLYSREQVIEKLKAYAMFLGQRKGQFLPTLEPLDKWIEKNL